MFRTARPTDLLGLLRFAAQRVPNQAYPRRRLGGGDHPRWAFQALLTPWVPHRGTLHTLVLTQGPRRGGLVALRGQRGLAVWEVDQLLLASRFPETCAELLARLDTLVVQARGERVFLRVAEGSPVLDAAREAGYRPYLTERLYHLRRPAPQSVQTPDRAPGLEVRVRRPEDDYPLFRLYNAAMPVSVRAAEGLTFREWQEASTVRWQGGPGARDLLVLGAGEPLAWVRKATGPSLETVVAILAHPGEPQAAQTALRVASQAGGAAGVCLLVVEQDPRAQADLEGFIPGEAYTSLVHQVGARLVEPAFMPARV